MALPEEEKQPEEEEEGQRADDDQSFAGLRPGAFTKRGKMQPHERSMWWKLVPLGVGMVVVIASPKPDWWPWWVTLSIVGTAFVLGIVIVVRGLEMPR